MKPTLMSIVTASLLFPTSLFAESFPHIVKYTQEFGARSSESPQIISISDFDNDGFDDFALAIPSVGERVKIKYGDAKLTFQRELEIPNLPPSLNNSITRQFSQHLFADVNGDGISDLLGLELPSKSENIKDYTLVLRLGALEVLNNKTVVHAFSSIGLAFSLPDYSPGDFREVYKMQALDFDQDGDLDLTCRVEYRRGSVKLSNNLVFENLGKKASPHALFKASTEGDGDPARFAGERFYNDPDNKPEVVFTTDAYHSLVSVGENKLPGEINVFETFRQGNSTGFKIKSTSLIEGGMSPQAVRLASLRADGYDGLVALFGAPAARIEYLPYDSKQKRFGFPETLIKSQDMAYQDFVTLDANNDGHRDIIVLFETISGGTSSKVKNTFVGLGMLSTNDKTGMEQFNAEFSLDKVNNLLPGNKLRSSMLHKGDFNGDGYADLLVENEIGLNSGDASVMLVTVLANHADWGPTPLGRNLEFISTNPLTNWSGKYKEKWLQSLMYNDLHGGWYFILPNGRLYRWRKQDDKNLSRSELIAPFHPSYYTVLRKLIYAGYPGYKNNTVDTNDTPPSADAFIQKYGLVTAGNFYENWFGKGWNERWVYSRTFGDFVYVLSNGEVYRYIKGKNPKNSTGHPLLEKMGAGFYSTLLQTIPKR